MKKIILVALSLGLVGALSACGKANTPVQTPKQTVTKTTPKAQENKYAIDPSAEAPFSMKAPTSKYQEFTKVVDKLKLVYDVETPSYYPYLVGSQEIMVGDANSGTEIYIDYSSYAHNNVIKKITEVVYNYQPQIWSDQNAEKVTLDNKQQAVYNSSQNLLVTKKGNMYYGVISKDISKDELVKVLSSLKQSGTKKVSYDTDLNTIKLPTTFPVEPTGVGAVSIDINDSYTVEAGTKTVNGNKVPNFKTVKKLAIYVSYVFSDGTSALVSAENTPYPKLPDDNWVQVQLTNSSQDAFYSNTKNELVFGLNGTFYAIHFSKVTTFGKDQLVQIANSIH